MSKKRYYEGILYVVNKRFGIHMPIYRLTSKKGKRRIANEMRNEKSIDEQWPYMDDDRFYFRIKRHTVKRVKK